MLHQVLLMSLNITEILSGNPAFRIQKRSSFINLKIKFGFIIIIAIGVNFADGLFGRNLIANIYIYTC